MGKNQRHQNRRGNERIYRGKNVNPMTGPAQMGQYGIRLIKQMAFGEFNIQRDGAIFENYEFLTALLKEVSYKIVEQSYYVQALNFAYPNVNDNVLIRMKNKHLKSHEGWSYVYGTIGSIMSTRDIGLLGGLLNRLSDYKHVL